MHTPSVRVIAFATLAALSLAACGGSPITFTPAPLASATPSASPANTTFPTPAAATSTASFTIGSSAVSQNFGTLSGIGASLAFPSANATSNVSVVSTTGSAINAASAKSVGRRSFVVGPLPQGPYLYDLAFTPATTITLGGAIVATFDLGPLLGTTQAAQLAALAAIAPAFAPNQIYIGIEDPVGNLSAIGPIVFSGTTVSASLPSGLTIVGGTTYHIGVHVGVLTPVVVATSSPTASATPTVLPSATPTAMASPTATATASPTASATASPTAAASATPTIKPTASPTASASASPLASATPHATTQNIDSAGHAYTDANAFVLGSVGGYSGSIGYPINNSSGVTAATTAYQGLATGAPSSGSGTVVYSTSTTLNGGPPGNQSSITFTGSGTTIQGAITVPAGSTGTYSITAYVPAYYGNTAIYSANNLTPSGGTITFSSPFNSGSSVTLPTGVTIYIELSQP